MARTIAQVKAQMIAEKNAQAALAGLDSPSQTAFWNLYLYLVAAAIVVFESIIDLTQSTWEGIASAAYPGSAKWIQQRVFQFQYDATTPQYVQYDATTNAVNYPVVDATKRIITRCSVSTLVNKTVLVKVAKSEPPQALENAEKNAVSSYLYDIGFAGIDYSVVSVSPDRIAIGGTVYYQGQYSSTIQASVIAALNAYLAGIPFDGAVTVNGIIDAVQAVAGVTDFRPTSMGGRRSSTSFANRTLFYDLTSGVNLLKYSTYAGYCIQEDTADYTFIDTIGFVAV